MPVDCGYSSQLEASRAWLHNSKECDLLIYFDQVIKILWAKLVAKIKFLQASKIASKRSFLIWFAADTAAAVAATFVAVGVAAFAKHSFVNVISMEQ